MNTLLEWETIRILEDHDAIIRGHFVGRSGRHLDTYVNKDALYPFTATITRLCRILAREVREVFPEPIQAVVGPAIGGSILAQWTACHLNMTDTTDNRTLALYAEKADYGRFELRRGYDRMVSCKATLVVDDVLTTGGTARAVAETVRSVGGRVLGVAALVNRDGVTAEHLGVPFLLSLADLDLFSWAESECPLCRARIPLNHVFGSGVPTSQPSAVL